MLGGVTVSYRGARYEIGQAERCYAVWATGAPRAEPLERWPETPEGWSAAWSYFMHVEDPSTIAPARALPSFPAFRARTEIVASVLLVVGVAVGAAGLFPRYLNGASLAHQPAELVPHVIYLVAWSATATAVILGAHQRTWALLGAGTSAVTFGLFFSDVGNVMANGAHIMGAGLVLAFAGWLACAAGSAMALQVAPTGGPGRPHRSAIAAVALLVLAAAGAAAAFAPSWDSYVLRTATGQSQTVTAGNAFANPVPVVAGDVAVMAALVAAVAVAALWRPARQGAALLAGAVIPMVGQVVSALIQVSQPTSTAQFGIPPSQAAQAGITVTNGLTVDFWIYSAFVLTLAVSCAWLIIMPSDPAVMSAPSDPAATSAADPASAYAADPASGYAADPTATYASGPPGTSAHYGETAASASGTAAIYPATSAPSDPAATSAPSGPAATSAFPSAPSGPAATSASPSAPSGPAVTSASPSAPSGPAVTSAPPSAPSGPAVTSAPPSAPSAPAATSASTPDVDEAEVPNTPS